MNIPPTQQVQTAPNYAWSCRTTKGHVYEGNDHYEKTSDKLLANVRYT